MDEIDDGEDDSGGDDRLDRTGDDLLEPNHPDRHRRKDAILDLLAEAELLHERQRDRLDPLEVDRDRDQSRHEHRRERDSGRASPKSLPDLREHIGEDKDEEQRLHDRPGYELANLTTQDADVTFKQCEEG